MRQRKNIFLFCMFIFTLHWNQCLVAHENTGELPSTVDPSGAPSLAPAKKLPTSESKTTLSSLMNRRHGCFLLYDLGTTKLRTQFGPGCREAVSPGKTFTLFLAYMAFTRGILEDGSTVLKWDGQSHGKSDANHDLRTSEWIDNGSKWFSGRLIEQIGVANVEHQMVLDKYGNADLKSGYPSPDFDSSLKISPLQQLNFLKKIGDPKSPILRKNFLTLVSALPAEAVAQGMFSGVNGSSHETYGPGVYVGWAVGFFHIKTEVYAVVTEFRDQALPGDRWSPGITAMATLREGLEQLLPSRP